MAKLINDQLVSIARPFSAGDFLFLPGLLSDQEMQAAASEALSWNWLKELLDSLIGKERVSELLPWHILLEVSYSYQDHKLRTGHEPEWLQGTSDLIRRYVSLDDTQPALTWQPLAIVPSLHLTGIGYRLRDGGFQQRVREILKLKRLIGIGQLACKQHPEIGRGKHSSGAPFWHNRFEHCQDVAALAVLIAENNPELSREEVLTLQAGGLAHDGLTPPGGDSTKQVRPDWFGEEDNFPLVLNHRVMVELRKIGVSPEHLTDMIQGRGRLGQILDLADKIAYVGRDADSYLEHWRLKLWHGECLANELPAGMASIEQLVRDIPHVCGLWDSVCVAGNQVFVQDVDRMEQFLRLRGLLFHGLYLNPHSEFLKYIFVQVVLSYLFDHNLVTKEKLLAQDDNYLWRLINRATRVPNLIEQISEDDDVKVEAFVSMAEAVRRERELADDFALDTHVELISPSLNSGTDILVGQPGKLMPFKQARPDAATLIEDQVRVNKPVRLYWFPKPEFNEPIMEMFDYARQQRFAQF